MQSHNLLEEYLGHMWCIRSLSAKNEVHHLRESTYYEDGIRSLLCARKSQHEIQAQVFPTILGAVF